MQQIFSTDEVQLAQELEELALHRCERGTVMNSWHYPTVAYEVEFRPQGKPIRVLLLEHQIVVPLEEME